MLAAAALGLLPSVLEWALHGDFVGHLGSRLRLVLGLVAGAWAAALGASIGFDREGRERLGRWMPWVAVAMLLHAVIGRFELLPDVLIYLGENHQAAAIVALIALALAPRMAQRRRVLTVGFLIAALAVTGSRWGMLIGLGTLPLYWAAFSGKGWLLKGVFSLTPIFIAGVVLGGVNLTKFSLAGQLFEVAAQRPLSGVGPGAIDHQVLRYSTLHVDRITHAETFPVDWPSVLGWPLTVLVLAGLLGLVVWRVVDVDRRRRLAAVALAAIVLHEFADFSLTSGVVSSLTGFLLGWVVPRGWLKAGPSRVGYGLAGLVLLVLVAGSWRYDPRTLEREDRLHELSERLGDRTYRWWWQRALVAEDHRTRIAAYGEALSIAPGHPKLWFAFADALTAAGAGNQARLAYATGMQVNRWPNQGLGRRLARTAPSQTVLNLAADQPTFAVGVAQVMVGRGAEGLGVLRRLLEQHDRVEIRNAYRSALVQPGLDPDLALSEALRLWREAPDGGGQAWVLMQRIYRSVPASEVGRIFAGLVAQNPQFCRALSRWPERRRNDLWEVAKALRKRCILPTRNDPYARQVLLSLPAR
jgi:hypothetical protein